MTAGQTRCKDSGKGSRLGVSFFAIDDAVSDAREQHDTECCKKYRSGVRGDRRVMDSLSSEGDGKGQSSQRPGGLTNEGHRRVVVIAVAPPKITSETRHEERQCQCNGD